MDWAQIIVSMITLAGVVFTTIYSKGGNRHAKEINDAVNHVHGTGKPRLYDLVLSNTVEIKEVKKDTDELIKWKQGYENSPWATGEKAQEWIKENREELNQIRHDYENHLACNDRHHADELSVQ